MSRRPQQFKTTFAQAAPGANQDIFATALTPVHDGSTLRIAVSLATSSVFNVTITGGSTKTSHLNGGTALAAASLYTFTIPARKAYAYNFQVATDGVIDYLTVEEVLAGGAI